MKKLLLLLLFPLFLGSTSKYEYKYEMPFAPVVYHGVNDSIPTIDKFGRIRNGIIAQRIIDTLNNDPSGVKLTRAELEYIRSIVGGLYTIGVWQKCKALYGFVGGNAWKHKWNWKDMRNLDAAFRMTFSGGVTHNSNGVQFNGTTGFADTKLIPSTHLSNTSTNLYAYVKSSSTSTANASPYLMGVLNTPVTGNSFGLTNRHNGTSNLKLFTSTNPTATDAIFETTPTSNPYLGSFSGNFSSSVISLWSNGVKISPTTTQNSSQPDLPSLAPLYIGASSSFSGGLVTVGNYDNKLLCAVMIGAGLTDSEIIKRDNVLNYSEGIK